MPKFEIGYWCHTKFAGQGFASEATRALTRLAFAELDAVRVELRMDERNERSWQVAQRTGFDLEGVLRADARDNSGRVCNTRVYAMVDPARLRHAD